MKNTPPSEQELEKHDETQSETPLFQTQETVGTENQSDLKGQKRNLQDELAEAKDKYIRLYAEFDNFRRRTAKEKLEMIQSANEGLIQLLLPVLDDFERAEKSFTDNKTKEAEGFFLIQNKFKKIVEQCGVKPMGTSVGDEFNPDLHEAITQIPTVEERLKGKIVDLVDKGYLLNDKVIRFAKVVIGY
jgi:molecular chaperone GrpE